MNRVLSKKELILALTEINVIKFGEFTLRSAAVSPVYIDLRLIIAYPPLLRQVANHVWKAIQIMKPTLLCGVPYTALPIAVCIALDQNIPLLICRKEPKGYGTKKQIEGVFEKGQHCLLIEDVITTAGSVLNTIDTLQGQGLKVTDVAVVVDRQEGGREALEAKGFRLHSVFTLSELVPKK